MRRDKNIGHGATTLISGWYSVLGRRPRILACDGEFCQNWQLCVQGFIQPFDRVTEGHRREAPSGGLRGLGRGVHLSRDGGPEYHPWENFEISGAIWCNLVHFGKKLTFLQFFTFVSENIAIMFDSGIDTVAYYFTFLVVWMFSVSCCSRLLAYTGHVSWSSNRYFTEGEFIFSRGSNFISGGTG